MISANTILMYVLRKPQYRFNKFQVPEDLELKALVRAVRTSGKWQRISPRLAVVNFHYPVIGGTASITPHLLFIRRCYPALLNTVRSAGHRVLLHGNPGTGKSAFLMYFLARMLNPSLFPEGPVPPDASGSTAIPENIVLQKEPSIFHVMPSCRSIKIPGDVQDFFSSIDNTSRIYLLDPKPHLNHPDTEAFLEDTVPLFAAISDLHKFKSLCQNCATVYYPTWELEELLDAANYLRNFHPLPEALYQFFDPKLVQERFEEFGGIFRFVLPKDISVPAKVRNARQRALQATTASKFLKSSSIGTRALSSLIGKISVRTTGERAFKEAYLDFASTKVEEVMRSKFLREKLIPQLEKCHPRKM